METFDPVLFLQRDQKASQAKIQLLLEILKTQFKSIGAFDLVINGDDCEFIWQQLILHLNKTKRPSLQLKRLFTSDTSVLSLLDQSTTIEANDADDDETSHSNSAVGGQIQSNSRLDSCSVEIEVEEANVGNGIMYDQFFDGPPPDDEYDSEIDKPRPSKRVHFLDQDDDVESIAFNEDVSEEPSTYEKRQKSLKRYMKEMENELIAEKPWYLTGEAAAQQRPENSLLDEYLTFQQMSSSAPLITQSTTKNLEDIIKRRIRDKIFDDVERILKPAVTTRSYQQPFELNQNKPQQSLSEVYEKEYLKKIDNDKQDYENPTHQEIRSLTKDLFQKLDALSNFHYLPKIPEPEVKKILHVPSLTCEEAVPVMQSNSSLVAPEEIKKRLFGSLQSQDERTKTDKNRALRQRKVKAKAKSKNSQSMTRKKVTETELKKIGKIIRTKNADLNGKLTSSSSFFKSLQSTPVRAKSRQK